MSRRSQQRQRWDKDFAASVVDDRKRRAMGDRFTARRVAHAGLKASLAIAPDGTARVDLQVVGAMGERITFDATFLPELIVALEALQRELERQPDDWERGA